MFFNKRVQKCRMLQCYQTEQQHKPLLLGKTKKIIFKTFITQGQYKHSMVYIHNL